jgi:uncharacterized protein YjbI with pentapeptide repeats
MANEEHLAILRRGVRVWNRWRVENHDIRPDLSNAQLSGADLSTAMLNYANLRGTNLGGANLSSTLLLATDLYLVNLRGASLHNANLSHARLTDTSLINASLTGANLSNAHMFNTPMHSADLSGAVMGLTAFGDLDLSGVKGLETVTHLTPSHISIGTLVKSRGKIPDSFLRGCGVPESFIEYLPSLLGAMQPIEFYSCFISYSTKDEAFAKRLHSKMRDNNLRVWFANEQLKGGRKLHEQIDEAIRVYDKFIIVLSPESLRSKWVMNEVRRTRKAELTNNQRKFFPIALMDYRELEGWECIDPETGTDLAAEIREYYVPDFRDWKNHDSFEKAFAQLLEGLKAVDAPPAPRIEPKVNPKDKPQNPQTVIAAKKRRLEKLEHQAAVFGISTPPEVANEIEDLRREIRELEGRQ